MLECRACTLRAIRAIAGDAFPTKSSLTRPLALTPHIANRPARRRIATTAPRNEDVVVERDALSDLKPIDPPSPPSIRSNKGGQIQVQNERQLKLELVHLKDPVKFAKHVEYTLRCDKPDKALDLCRVASKDMDVTVSWNHVIDWNIQKGRTNEAIRIFNEMKKRGQFPDAYTYTRMFAGFGKMYRHPENYGFTQAQHKDLLRKAMAIYESLAAPNSRVKPGIIHTNSVLRLCALAMDIDSVWSIASKIPPSGPGAADHVTYATILGAIKQCATWKAMKQNLPSDLADTEVEELVKRQKYQAVDEGKRVWQDIIAKWRSGQIAVDEKLVVAMAKILLMSKRMEDWDDVLNLVQQTTKLERLVAPLGSPERHTEHVPQREREAFKPEEDEDGWTTTPAGQVFNHFAPERQHSHAWVQPGNGILSILIQACSSMRIPKVAKAYWDKLVNGHGLAPDLENFHDILLLLKINRASATAVHLVKDLHKRGLQLNDNTYVLAMAVIRRDWKNVNIMDIATDLIEDMRKCLPYPDLQVLNGYLSLALGSDDGHKIARALDRLDPFVHVLRSQITYGDEASDRLPAHVQLGIKAHAVELFRCMIGAIDTLMQRGLVPREDFNKWHDRRSQLNTFVGRAMNSVEAQRQNVEKRRQKKIEELRKGRGEDETREELENLAADFKGPRHVKDQRRIQSTTAGQQAVKMFKRRGRDAHKKPLSRQSFTPDEVESTQIFHNWKAPAVKERHEGLAKWRLDLPKKDLQRAAALRKQFRNAKGEVEGPTEKQGRKEGSRKEEDAKQQEKEIWSFEGADSPAELAMNSR